MSSQRDEYEAQLRLVQRCNTKSQGAGKAEAALGVAYQRMVVAGHAPQIKKKYRGGVK